MSEVIRVVLQGQSSCQCVRIHPSQLLGAGSYGTVCRATLDELPCAAKLLHSTFFGTNDPGVANFTVRFEQECEFLSNLRHPCIVQFLGLVREPHNLRPILLMELMDESLTKFLERVVGPLPYHVQVNLIHDTTQALAYLHSNSIIHRDLSSNNILILAGSQAKVADFGMSKMVDVNPRMTPLTECPGMLVFMAPEALLTEPVYSDKLDIFSAGVLTIQILTRRFPNPGKQKKVMDFPSSPTGVIEVPVSERERRSGDLDEIATTHPLWPIAIQCIKDKEKERPDAAQLCQSLAALKEAQAYAESMQKSSEDAACEQKARATFEEREGESQVLEAQSQQALQPLAEEESATMTDQQEIKIKEQQLSISTTAPLCLDVTQPEARRHQTHHPVRENESSHSPVTHTQQRRSPTPDRLSNSKSHSCPDTGSVKQLVLHHSHPSVRKPKQQNPPRPSLGTRLSKEQTPPPEIVSEPSQLPPQKKIAFDWRTQKAAPDVMRRGTATLLGNTAYFNYVNVKVHAYNIDSDQWTRQPDCDREFFGFAVINDFLTAVGGRKKANSTNSLVSLCQGRWVELIPPMPTARCETAVVATADDKYTIVAGGCTALGNTWFSLIEILNNSTLQWMTACDLPTPVKGISATICSGSIHVFNWGYSVYTCNIDKLLSSCQSQSANAQPGRAVVWSTLPDVPVLWSTPATLCGKPIAVGGEGVSTIHLYSTTNNSWEVIGHMPTARRTSLVVVLPGEKILVVGGFMKKSLNTVELGAVKLFFFL